MVAIVDSSDVDAAWSKYIDTTGVPVVGGGSSGILDTTDPNWFAVGQTLDDYYINFIDAAKKVGASNIGEFYCAEAATCQEGVAPVRGHSQEGERESRLCHPGVVLGPQLRRAVPGRQAGRCAGADRGRCRVGGRISGRRLPEAGVHTVAARARRRGGRVVPDRPRACPTTSSARSRTSRSSRTTRRRPSR